MDILESDEQIAHNQTLWKYYPIGNVHAIWAILEDMRAYLSKDEMDLQNQVFEALEALDQRIRKNRHPLPKNKKRKTRK